MMRKNVEQLIESSITAHAVAAETGLPRNTVYRIFTKETKLSNVKFGTIEILSKYWEENRMIRVKRTELLTDSTLKFFALPQNEEEFNKHFPKEKVRKEIMIIDEDFYKALLINPVIVDEKATHYFVEGALDGITPYKYTHISTLNNITEHEYYSKVTNSDTADYLISKRLKDIYRQ